MHNTKLICILITWMTVLGSAGAQDQTSMPRYKPLRLSVGKRFPASQRFLLRMRDTPGELSKARIRAHAWDLFAGLTQDKPIWTTWYTKCDLGLKRCGTKFMKAKPNLHRSLRNFEIPVQSLEQLLGSSRVDEQSFTASFQEAVQALAVSSRALPQFASVRFNRAAAEHIRRQCLYSREGDGSKSTKPCPTLPASGKIKEFERGAVVLKTSWQLVIVDKNGIGRLRTWKKELWDNIQLANDNDILRFRTGTVRLDTKSKAECQNRDYRDGEPVPVKCFYAFELTEEDIKALRASPSDLVALSDTGMFPGNYLVLVAVHVTTKEIPEWVWATFWWDNHGKSDSRAAGRPKNIKPKWTHFLMETTLSGTTPLETDRGPKICFNPYLETSIPNGAISNCLQCHSKAAIGPPSEVSPFDLGILGRNGRTLASGNNPDPHYFDNRVQTDFIWSIADAFNDENLQPLMNLFKHDLHELQLKDLHSRQQDNPLPQKP
jgi:hypothetical protein